MHILYRPPKSEKEFEEYYAFRWELLRKPLDLERGSEQDALDQSAFHIAAFNDERIIAVGRLHIEKDNAARIRYMAVDRAFRNRGIGSQLLNELEKRAIELNVKKCWLYARESAVSFYIKNHYIVCGEAVSEITIPHQRMQKKLNH